MLGQKFLQINVYGVIAMVNNKEIVKYVFGESKKIRRSKHSDLFIKQIAYSDIENF